MNKTKVLTILAIALFLLNVGTITALILGKPKHPPGLESRGPKELIIERLQFNDAQIAQYQQLIEQHNQQMEEKQAIIQSSRNELYHRFFTDALR